MDNPLMKHMLCIECKKIYSLNFFYKFLLGVFLIMFSVFGISFATRIYSDNIPYQWIGIAIAGAILGLGIATLININKKQRNCHACNRQKSLIAIDTHDAIEFIKENNLSIPKPVAEKKASWQA